MRVQQKGRKREPDLSHRTYDILGIVLLALAAITFLSLLLSGTGVLGGAINSVFRALFGRGSWIVPLFLALLGGGFIAGKKKLEVTHMGIGLSLIFLSVLGMLAKSLHGDFFDSDIVAASGGYFGAVLGWVFDSLLGRADMIGLGALTTIGLVLCLPVPIRAILGQAKDQAKELKDKARPIVSEAKPRVKALVQAKMEEEEDQPRPIEAPKKKAKDRKSVV